MKRRVERILEVVRLVDDRSLSLFLGMVRKAFALFTIAIALSIPGCTNWATAGSEGVPMGKTMAFAACLATIAAAVVVLLQSESQRNGNTRRGGLSLGRVWLCGFTIVVLVAIAHDIINRLPEELETPWLRSAAPFPDAESCYKVCTDPEGEVCRVVNRTGSAC